MRRTARMVAKEPAPRELIDTDTAQRLLATWKGLRDGSITVAPQFQSLADEVSAAKISPFGLVDEKSLSAEALAFARSAGMTAQLSRRASVESAPPPRP